MGSVVIGVAAWQHDGSICIICVVGRTVTFVILVLCIDERVTGEPLNVGIIIPVVRNIGEPSSICEILGIGRVGSTAV